MKKGKVRLCTFFFSFDSSKKSVKAIFLAWNLMTFLKVSWYATFAQVATEMAYFWSLKDYDAVSRDRHS